MHYKKIDAFLSAHILRPQALLDSISQASRQAGLVPHAVSPLQAAFLALLIRISGARRVLEIGCLGGYSAIAMAEALPVGGSLLTTEIDTRTAAIARTHIEASGYADRIDLRTGPALAVLKEQIAEGDLFDFIFIDADKVNYRAYIEHALRLSRAGTLIIIDNIVRGGDILQHDPSANSLRGLRAMFDYIRSLKGVEMTAFQMVGEKGHDGMLLLRVEQGQ